MRKLLLALMMNLIAVPLSAKIIRDTLLTGQNDRVLLSYEITESGDNVVVRLNGKPRIIPSENLRKSCKGDLSLLKVVLFDRVGEFGSVKWNGMSPIAFMVPSGLAYDKSHDGYYIFGESTQPISFKKKDNSKQEISLPLYLAVYEKKQTYRLVSKTSKHLKVVSGVQPKSTPRRSQTDRETERIAIHTTEEIEADNDELTRALSSIQMVRQLLDTESEFPFSQTLQMEIYNLRSLKDRVKEPKVIESINEVLIMCNDKERELKEGEKNAALAAQAQEQALMAQQKAEEESKQKEADEKARIQEEKQQKKSMWMIIGGVVLALLAFIGNAVFKHFRDINNQKSIMQMQESLTRQAEHEASRRSREIIRNKAHQAVNKGKSRMRETLNDKQTGKKANKIKSI